MNRLFSLGISLATLTVFCIAGPVHAEGFYVSGELGMNFGGSVDVTGKSNDRASVCDGYINSMYETVTQTPGYESYNCTGPNRGAAGGWSNSISSDEGVLFGTAIGYHIRDSRFRVELEYFYRDTGYDETSDVPRASGVQGDKLDQELVRTIDRLGSLTSHNLFANLYMDFSSDSRFTPYVGVGVGFGFTEAEYGSVWARNSNASAITTGEGLPNATEIRDNLASTASHADTELDDTLFGYQILVGVDYELTESLMLGVKGRWVDYDSFKDGGVVWDPLRGHPPYLRTPDQAAGGDREHVSGRIKLDDIEMFAVSMNLKYQF